MNWHLPRNNEYSRWYEGIGGIQCNVQDAKLLSQIGGKDNQGYVILMKRGYQNWHDPEKGTGTYSTLKDAFSSLGRYCPESDLPQFG